MRFATIFREDFCLSSGHCRLRKTVGHKKELKGFDGRTGAGNVDSATGQNQHIITMISIITEEAPPQPEIKFPCLMQHLQSGIIVFFTSPAVGTIVNVGYSSHELGKHSKQWSWATNADVWKPFSGTLTIKND